MNTTTRCLLVVASAAALAATGSAQLAHSAANAAASVHPVVPPMPPPPAATVNASAAVQNAASVRAPVLPPATTAATAATATTSAAGASVVASHHPTVAGSVNAAATGQLHGAAGLDVAATQGLNATVAPATTTMQIQQATFESRKQLSADLEAKIEASEKALANLKTRANNANDRARDDLARALREVRAKEKELRSSLRTAAKTTRESTWGDVQAQLAHDYSAYANAVIAAGAVVDDSASASEPKS
ncbi:MAG: hypothetical protein KF715_13045 [Candidatus Didemnitutus sp.]|nr:hypothetical protein [Candidatus Didemnitutus sp.]